MTGAAQIHRFIIQKEVSGPAFCINGVLYSGIWLITFFLRFSSVWEDLIWKTLLEGGCTLVPVMTVTYLISPTSFSWQVAIVTFGLSPEAQTVGFWDLFCGLGEGWHMEQMFCIQLLPWASMQAHHTSRSRQGNMVFLNFETQKTIAVCFPTTMYKNSWNKNKILSLPLTQSLRDAINPAVILSPEIKISVVGFYFLLLETWDSNTWFGAADIWQHRSYLL